MDKKRLTLCERQLLYKLKLSGVGIREIARRLKRAASTVLRELVRNRPTSRPQDYGPYDRAKYADDEARKRQSKSRCRKRLKNDTVRGYVIGKLRESWTPELISGRISFDIAKARISHEAVYQFIYKERGDLEEHLPYARRIRRKRGSPRTRRARPTPAAPKRNIRERPEDSTERRTIGHWEGDTIVSRQSNVCIHTLTDRYSRYTIYSLLPACTSEHAYNSTLTALIPLPPAARLTLTHDNGGENLFHDRIENTHGIKVYFCDPYAAQQRGSVEWKNGSLRRVYPKKTDFRTVSRDALKREQHKINHRPMKVLGFRTPYEVFTTELSKMNTG